MRDAVHAVDAEEARFFFVDCCYMSLHVAFPSKTTFRTVDTDGASFHREQLHHDSSSCISQKTHFAVLTPMGLLFMMNACNISVQMASV